MRIFAYIRTILGFTNPEKNEAEVGKKEDPFHSARNLWVFRHFYANFLVKKVLIKIFFKLCAF